MSTNFDFSKMVAVSIETATTTPEQVAFAAWKLQRLGKITASNFHRIKRDGRSWSKGAKTLLRELVKELITREQLDISNLDAPAWGIKNEPLAIAAYETITGVTIQKVGFVTLKGHNLIGCTPDGRIADNLIPPLGARGIYIEVKCPFNPNIHENTITTNTIPRHYLPQLLGQMLITNASRIDFVSYDPRRTDDKQLHIIPLYRYQVAIELRELRKTLIAYERTLNNIVKQLNLTYPV